MTGFAIKEKTLQQIRRVLELEVLLRQVSGRQLGRAGRHPLQRIIPEGAAVGTSGHDPLFGTDHLILI